MTTQIKLFLSEIYTDRDRNSLEIRRLEEDINAYLRTLADADVLDVTIELGTHFRIGIVRYKTTTLKK